MSMLIFLDKFCGFLNELNQLSEEVFVIWLNLEFNIEQVGKVQVYILENVWFDDLENRKAARACKKIEV